MTVVFARAGRQLEGEARELGVGVSVGGGEVVEDQFARFGFGGDLGQPDGSLNGFDLAEKGPDPGKIVAPPVGPEPGGLGGDLPQVGMGQGPPRLDAGAQLVDAGGGVVLLLFGRETLALVEDDFILLGRRLALLGLGDGSDELGPTTVLDDFLGGLPLGVEFPVARRSRVGRVKDRLFEKRVGHFLFRSSSGGGWLRAGFKGWAEYAGS